MTASAVLRWFIALLIVSGSTACHTSELATTPAEPTYANWPESLDGLRFQWTAEPGIDLLLGPAVPIRAYLESHRTGDFTLNPDNVYPGFRRAVHAGPPNTDRFPDEPYELWYIQPFSDPRYSFGPAGNFYGNEYFHILELTPIDSGWRAYVCDGTYNVFRAGDDPNTYVPVHTPTESDPDPDRTAMNVWRIELTDDPNPSNQKAPSAVTEPQKGPAPAPLGDVFGPWRITGANPSTTWGPSSDPNSGPAADYIQRRQQCLDRMPHDAAQRHAFYTARPDTPPKPDPAIPGWPTESS
ncbi:hypothetical protein [Mycolicibacterium boenickei]|uniref:hypothetical protein n=1 Tax=Mycolicibacterium boenickei TaxID=146017 RepID=UPI001F1FD7D6|nr:hypothetical protein [Mycolicibacterium boenickei]